MTSMRVRVGGFAIAAGAAVALWAAPAAIAQEAPICLKGGEKLSDNRDNWTGTNGRDSVTGLRGKDKMNGRGGNDLVNGGRDNDVVRGGDGNDTICGGRGNDKLYGDDGNDTIYGEEESDKIYPGPGNDKVLGSAGNDKIYGFGTEGGQIVDDGIDLLDGGFNDDVIIAGGADTLLGYTHNDTLSTRTPDDRAGADGRGRQRRRAVRVRGGRRHVRR